MTTRDRIVILGAGTGGTLTANRLRRVYGDDGEIVVIDRDDRHLYQPGLLFVPFGLADPGEIARPRGAQLHDGVEFRLAEVDRVDTAANAVHLVGGELIAYDVLVVASGAVLLPEETEGLTGPGWGERIFTFFELESATALRDFDHDRLVINPVEPAHMSYLDAVAHGHFDAPAWAAPLWPASALATAIAAWQPVVKVRPMQLEGRRLLVLPLMAMSAALVLLFVDHFDRVSHLAAALAFATLIVAGVRLWLTLGEHMTLLGTSRGEATTDPLTGLRNRRALVNDLDGQVLDASPQRPLLLLLFDLNGFKSYNDTYGHPAGDALLTRLGTALSRAVADRGHAYRMGGDEFCVLTAAPADQHPEFAALTRAALTETRRRLRDHRRARHRHDRCARPRVGRRAPRRRPAHVRREEQPARVGRWAERRGAVARPHRTPPGPRRARRQRRRLDRQGRARAGHDEGGSDNAVAGGLAP